MVCSAQFRSVPTALLLQVELEAELTEELHSFGISPQDEGLTDRQLSEAMAELEQRRAEARRVMSPTDRKRYDYMRSTASWHVQRVREDLDLVGRLRGCPSLAAAPATKWLD